MRNDQYTANEGVHLFWFILILVLLIGSYEAWVSQQAGKALQQFDQSISSEVSR